MCAQFLSFSLQPHGLQPTRLLWPLDFLGKNTGADCHALLLGIFLTQGSNPHLCVSFIGMQITPAPPEKIEDCK